MKVSAKLLFPVAAAIALVVVAAMAALGALAPAAGAAGQAHAAIVPGAEGSSLAGPGASQPQSASNNVLADTTQGASSGATAGGASAASGPGYGTSVPQAPASSGSATPADGAVTDLAMSLVFDVSGSMSDESGLSGMTKLDSAKRQSADFVNSVAGAGSADTGGVAVRIGVASFASTGASVCDLSTDPAQVAAAIEGLTSWGVTNMYDGIYYGMQQLGAATGEKLMVLLSDGYNNEGHSNEEVLDLARQAAGEGIKIYTIGFGPAGDLDEDLLREIASVTGGTYAHEDSSTLSSAAVGLFATMMEAQLSATGQVLLSQTGSVAQGATASVGTFQVTQGGTLKAYLYWPGSKLDIILLDPQGNEVKDGYPGFSVDESKIPTTVQVANPTQGTWSMQVYGRQVSMANEPFYAATALVSTVVQATGASGGGSGSGGGILLLLAVVAAACVGGVYAFSVRRANAAKDQQTFGS